MLLTGAAMIYVLLLLILMLLWMADYDQWWLKISNIFALFLFFPLPVFGLVALLIQSRCLRIAVVVGVLLFVGQFWEVLKPPLPVTQSGKSLRIVTFNQLARNKNVSAVLNVIAAQQADVVILQEISKPLAQSLSSLKQEYPYQSVALELGGLALLSRYPLTEVESTMPLGFEGQHAILDLNGRRIRLLNVHLPSPWISVRRDLLIGRMPIITGYRTERREGESAALLQAIDETQGPLIVLGDFNTTDREAYYRSMAARMTDAFRQAAWGPGLTFPNGRQVRGVNIPVPLVRIDYVWLRDLQALHAWTDCTYAGSDHCVVGADISP